MTVGLFGKDKGEEVTLKVEGMSCKHCSGKVEKGLRDMDGVLSADVDLDRKEAKIRFDAAKVKAEDLAKKIVDVGYRVV